MEKIESFQGPYRFLSNFFIAPVEFEGISYPSVEHAFQAAKVLDIKGREFIASLATPGAAKRAGKNVVLRKDWEEQKLAIMRTLLRAKFKKGSNLARMLLQTQNAELCEGNSWGDRYWGVCGGEGENHLGKLLMQVRAELRG